MFYSDGGIYDPSPIHPVAKMGENLGIYMGEWSYYRVHYTEPMPEGPATEFEMVTVSGATTLAANGTIQKTAIPGLRLKLNEMLHLRWYPLENVEGILWQYPTDGRFYTQQVQCRVTWDTINHDPYLATTTFWEVGQVGQEDLMNLEVRNPMGVATAIARFRFFGYKYLLKPLKMPEALESRLREGDPEAAKEAYKAVTFIPARGRAA